jgi:hypothetical protein
MSGSEDLCLLYVRTRNAAHLPPALIYALAQLSLDFYEPISS